MKVIIIGAGELGLLLASRLSDRRHDVVVVDMAAERMDDFRNIEALFLPGNGTDVNVLKQAGAQEADILMAISGDETTNVLSCQLAKRLGTKKTFCRIYSRGVFSEEDGITAESFGIDMAFSSVGACVEQISGILHNRILLENIRFPNPNAMIDVIQVPLNSDITNKPLKELPCGDLLKEIRIAAMIRGKELVLPHGDTVLEAGDRLYVSGRTEHVREFVRWLAQEGNDPLRHVVVVGATDASEQLIANLQGRHLSIDVIEQDHRNAERLQTSFSGEISVHSGDPTHTELLNEVNVEDCDAFVAMTEADEINILSCLLASRRGAKKVVAMTNKVEYMDILPSIEKNGCWFNATQISANTILRMTLNKALRVDSELKSMDAEIVEQELTRHSSFKNRMIQDCDFPKDLLIALILRGDEVICPNGQSMLQEGDSLIFIANSKNLKKILKHF